MQEDDTFATHFAATEIRNGILATYSVQAPRALIDDLPRIQWSTVIVLAFQLGSKTTGELHLFLVKPRNVCAKLNLSMFVCGNG